MKISLIEYIDDMASQKGRTQRQFRRAATFFKENRIASATRLLKEFCKLPVDVKFAAICYFLISQTERAIPALLRELANPNGLVQGAAAATVAHFGGDRVLRRVCRMLTSCSDSSLVYVVVFVINEVRNISRACSRDRVLHLAHVVSNEDYDLECRAFAIEAMSRHLPLLKLKKTDPILRQAVGSLREAAKEQQSQVSRKSKALLRSLGMSLR